MARFVHRLPGRVRLQLPLLKGAPDQLGAAVTQLQATCGVTCARGSALTGTLTIHFDEDRVRAGQIVGKLARAGFSGPVIQLPRAQRVAPPDLPAWVKPAAKVALMLAARALLPAVAERLLGRTAAKVIGTLI